jgi:hypothetical protein
LIGLLVAGLNARCFVCASAAVGCDPMVASIFRENLPMSFPQEPAHGTIDLSECLTVKSADEKTEKPHSFEVATPDQVYYMYAANEKEKDDWIGAIGRFVTAA